MGTEKMVKYVVKVINFMNLRCLKPLTFQNALLVEKPGLWPTSAVLNSQLFHKSEL